MSLFVYYFNGDGIANEAYLGTARYVWLFVWVNALGGVIFAAIIYITKNIGGPYDIQLGKNSSSSS